MKKDFDPRRLMKKDFDPRRLMKREFGLNHSNEIYFDNKIILKKFEEWLASQQKQEGIPEEVCVCMSSPTHLLNSNVVPNPIVTLNPNLT